MNECLTPLGSVVKTALCLLRWEPTMVIWITGLSGSGKTTLCTALRDLLKPQMPGLVVLDGDAVRAVFGHDLAYDEASRARQIGRIQALAKMLSNQGLVVLVAALYSHPDLLAWNRANLAPYFEVYLDAPLALVRARDSKGLYGGGTRDVVGLDIPWHPPANPDLIVDAATEEAPTALARRVAAAVWPLYAAVADAAQ